MTFIDTKVIRDRVLKSGPTAILLFVPFEDKNNALLFFKIEFPHYLAEHVQHSLCKSKGAAVVAYPPTSTIFQDMKEKQKIIESMDYFDLRFNNVEWKLSFDSFARFCANYRRISLTFGKDYASNAFKHFSTLKWSNILRHGTRVTAYYDSNDKFDMNVFDIDYAQRHQISLPADLAQFDFTNWIVESGEKTFIERVKGLFS